jgi:hypothetical protein
VALALWATLRHVQESRDVHATGRFDWLGAGVVALAVGGLTFGTIYGQQREWRDAVGFIALAVGIVATIALPFLMARRPNPLVPLDLFRSRNFSVTNISTFVIYGALYVTAYYIPILQQGTLGYTAAAAGLALIPGTLFLVFFSERFGKLAGRYGPRWFMAIGPAIMGCGILWLLRLPVSSQAWGLEMSKPSTFIPPVSYLIDILPFSILFGIGLMIMVAPLTTALMASVPVEHSGLGSAINNAISRVGPQLAGALIFVAISGSFYVNLAARAPGLNVNSAQVRTEISPLNRPTVSLPPNQLAATRAASTDAFHLAMLVAAALLFAGALVNGAGIQQPTRVEIKAASPKPQAT